MVIVGLLLAFCKSIRLKFVWILLVFRHQCRECVQLHQLYNTLVDICIGQGEDCHKQIHALSSQCHSRWVTITDLFLLFESGLFSSMYSWGWCRLVCFCLMYMLWYECGVWADLCVAQCLVWFDRSSVWSTTHLKIWPCHGKFTHRHKQRNDFYVVVKKTRQLQIQWSASDHIPISCMLPWTHHASLTVLLTLSVVVYNHRTDHRLSAHPWQAFPPLWLQRWRSACHSLSWE